MDARRLVVLTTDDTCSASEAVINGLRPYMPIYTVGSATCGKPFGMELIEFGDKILSPVTARLLNSRGEGHYSSGIRADFKAKDDLNHQLGDPQEGMLKKALEVLEEDGGGKL
jgi:C-terminal processing protease CtpA/Prc